MDLDVCKKCGKQLFLYHFPPLTEHMKELNGLSCGHHQTIIILDEEGKKVWKEILTILDLDYKQTIIKPIIKFDKLEKIKPLLRKLCPSKYCEYYMEQYMCFNNTNKNIQ